MKKLLNISVIAALAILPVAANAAVGEVVATGTTPSHAENAVNAGTGVNPGFALVSEVEGDATSAATAKYVKGAYNAAIKAVNTVAEQKQDNLTQDQLDAVNSGITSTKVGQYDDIVTDSANYAKKEGVSASIDKATATGDIEATVTGSVSGSLTSDTTALRIGGGTITNNVTQGSVTVPYATAWSGSAPLMVSWGDTESTANLGVAVTASATNDTASNVSGTAVTSTLANAEVQSGNISHTLTNLTVSGSATQTGATFDVQSAGYFDNATDNTAEYAPTAG